MNTLQPLFIAGAGLTLGIVTVTLLSWSGTHDRDPPDGPHTTDQHHDDGEG